MNGRYTLRTLVALSTLIPWQIKANTSLEKFYPHQNRIAIISVADQKMRIKENGKVIREFPVSTSKFGLGDSFNSFRTPLGTFEVAQRIGHNVPLGGIFYKRHFTGRYYDITDPGIERLSRDIILSRIIWLRGLEDRNRNAYQRGIYIHGTNQESLVGRPVSYGCIRMRNHDVVEAFELLAEGSRIVIQTDPLPRIRRERQPRPDKDPLTEPEPVSPPVVPEDARLVASASERGARPPTILRSLTRQPANTPTPSNTHRNQPPPTPPLIATSASTSRQTTPPQETKPQPRRDTAKSESTRTRAEKIPAIPADQIAEGWALDAIIQRRAEAKRQEQRAE